MQKWIVKGREMPSWPKTEARGTIPRPEPAQAPPTPPRKTERKPMALQEKFKGLAVRVREVPAALDKRADALLNRLDAAEQRGADAMAKMEAYVNDIEQGVKATEDAVNQLTNGAPTAGEPGASA